MSNPQIDELVERIGDEILARIGASGAAPTEQKPACGCDHASEPAAAPSASRTRGLDARLIGAVHHPAASAEQVEAFCAQAIRRKLSAVVVAPRLLAAAVRVLGGSGVRAASTAGYPDGGTFASVKLAETESALRLGAEEVALVVSAGALKAGDLDSVFAELRVAAKIAHDAGARLIAVVETSLLSRQEKLGAAALAGLAGADSVATGTGVFSHEAPSTEDVRLLRTAVGEDAELIVGGGIASLDQAAVLLAAGADRAAVDGSILGQPSRPGSGLG